MSAPVSTEQIEEMYQAYCSVPTIGHVARTCGVSPTTARKYIKHGDVERGVESIEVRYKRTLRLTSRLSEEAVAQSFSEVAKNILPRVDELEQLCSQAADALNGSFETKKPRLIELANAIRIAVETRKWLYEMGREEERAAEGRPIANLLVALQERVEGLKEEDAKRLQQAISEFEQTGELPEDITEMIFGEPMH